MCVYAYITSSIAATVGPGRGQRAVLPPLHHAVREDVPGPPPTKSANEITVTPNTMTQR